MPGSTSSSFPTIDAGDGVVVTPEILERVRERIATRAAAYFPGVGEARVSLRRLGEASSYPLFVGEIARAADPPREVIVKFAPTFPGNNEGLTEYRHLRLMRDALGDGGELRVPRPLDFFEDVNALVMERVGGERLSRVFLRDGSRLASAEARARLERAVARCGRWLRAYHDANGRGEAAAFGGDFGGKVDEKLELLGAHGFCPLAAAEARATVARLQAAGRDMRVPLADMHGDYGPQNVHAAADCIYVFDLNYHVAAPVYEDIGYFLVTLETMNPFPRQWLFDRRRVAGLRGPFLAGYFGTNAGNPGERELCIEGYYIKSLLFRCAKQRRNTARRGRVALAAFDAVALRRMYPRRIGRQCERLGALLAAAGAGRLP